jgi:hypothetical protein
MFSLFLADSASLPDEGVSGEQYEIQMIQTKVHQA